MTEMFQSLEDLFGRSRRGRLGHSEWIHFALCLFILVFHLVILVSARFERVEHIFLDYFFRQRPALASHPSIVLVEIDDASIQSIGSWPWPWRYHAELVNNLKKWDAKAIVFDLTFKDADASYEDDELERALQETDNVYLPVLLESTKGKTIWVHSLPIVLEPDTHKQVWTHPVSSLEKNAKGVGHVNIEPDSDGVVRRVSAYLSHLNETHPYLGIRLAGDLRGVKGLTNLRTLLPLDGRGHLMINWPGLWRNSFTHYSYADVVRSDQAMQQGLTPVVDPQVFKNKICFIGLTVKDLANEKVTPFGSRYPLLGIHASVVQSILRDQYIFPVSMVWNALCLAGIGLIASILFVVFRNVPSFIAGLGLGVVWLVTAFFLFWQKGVWVYVAHPLFLIVVLFIFSAIYNHIISGKERSKLFDLATRDGLTGLYVIRHFREILNRMVFECHKVKQPLSLILIDLDNFKWINDTYGHPAGDMVLKKVAKAIYSCFRATRPVQEADFVARYGGEEFIVMLRDAELQEVAEKVSERIRKKVEETKFEWEGTRIPVTISLGVASLHPGEKVPDKMVHRADKALYEAKRAGKNRVCLES